MEISYVSKETIRTLSDGLRISLGLHDGMYSWMHSSSYVDDRFMHDGNVWPLPTVDDDSFQRNITLEGFVRLDKEKMCCSRLVSKRGVFHVA